MYSVRQSFDYEAQSLPEQSVACGHVTAPYQAPQLRQDPSPAGRPGQRTHRPHRALWVLVAALACVAGVLTALLASGPWGATGGLSGDSAEGTQIPDPVADSGLAPVAPEGGAPDDPAPAGTEGQGWALVWQDEFTGTELDPEYWFPYSGSTAEGVGRHDPENVTVADGVLTITSSGRLSGGASMGNGRLYGRWEFRARAEPGTGYNPGLMLWPDAEDWPEGGEVNVMEIPDPQRRTAKTTVHYGEDNSQLSAGLQGDFTQWNVYAVEWTADHVAVSVNGREVLRTEAREAIPPRRMHLTVQQDIGPMGDDFVPAPDATTPAQVRMQVDWVRIYAPTG